MANQRSVEGPSDLERAVETGMMTGMVAAVPMGMFAMTAAATYQHLGFFTPMYRIAAVLDPTSLLVSLQEADAGSPFYFDPQPMFAGGAMHLALGGFFGVVFALLARSLRVRGPAALAAGVGYGLAVMALMGLVVLPLVADLLGGGRLVGDAASIVGWPTFAAWHVLYGLALGVWTLARPWP
jgi:hypothetical protein